MKKYIEMISDKKQRLTLQNMQMLINYGLIPLELEFCKKIKCNPNFVNSKIIVTTSVHDKSAVLDAGVDLYLPKPYEIPNLIKWVDLFIREFNR